MENHNGESQLADSHSPAEVHSQRNRLTRDNWSAFAPHRNRVTEMILNAARDRSADLDQTRLPTLCVLGAGNGNDIDFDKIADHYSEITLVDLDCDALQACLDRQNLQRGRKLEFLVKSI
jgi:hypothetical protein